MSAVFEAINGIFRFVTPISDWIWDFPRNVEWWSSLPILGNLTLAVVLLIGSGIYFTVKTGFIQVTHFKDGIRAIVRKNADTRGISPAAAFFLSTAMRVGPGNIIGVTGAITTGGPGALFWMWVSAFFGMATAYVESTLAQIFKRKDGDEFVGGLPFYGRKLLKNSAAVGIGLSFLYLIYAVFCFPAQGFNALTAVGEMAGILTGKSYSPDSSIYWITAVLILVFTAYFTFGGIKKVTKLTDKMVPLMAVVYCLTVIALIAVNIDRIPTFFTSIFVGAFKPEAIFGGAFGIALQQGIKRGLMSNEAGQGTITMAAAASNAKHPCEQGCVQAVGVFLDTIVICTMTGFILVMGHMWTSDSSAAWLELDKLPKFLSTVTELSHGSIFSLITTFLITLCFGLFAYTTLIGFISFSEISAARISPSRKLTFAVRVLCLVVIAFGMTCSIAGYNLSNLWAFSDLGNILIVYANLPLLFIGAKYVFIATKHYKRNDGSPFTSDAITSDTIASDAIDMDQLDYWQKTAPPPPQVNSLNKDLK